MIIAPSFGKVRTGDDPTIGASGYGQEDVGDPPNIFFFEWTSFKFFFFHYE